MRRFTLDGQELDLYAFLVANQDAFETRDIEAIVALEVGEEITYGGGAAATSVLRRVA